MACLATWIFIKSSENMLENVLENVLDNQHVRILPTNAMKLDAANRSAPHHPISLRNWVRDSNTQIVCNTQIK